MMITSLPTRKIPSFTLTLLFTVFAVGQGATNVHEVEQGLFLLLGGEGESCSEACTKSGLKCTYESLEAGASYGSASNIIETVAASGGKCASVRGERTGKAFPIIDGRDRCFGAPSWRTNFDCDAVSSMSSPGRRVCSCEATEQGPSFVPTGYSLSWRDDFNGNDLDSNNWSRGLVYDADPSQHVLWNAQEGGPHLLNAKYDGYILDEDSYVENGKLVLANTEHNPPIQGTAPTGTFRYSSGWINSLHKRYYNGSEKGSYLEIRAKFPSGNKVWPAIWMVAEEPVWPPEIDIWEYFGVFYNAAWGVDEMHLRNIYGEWPNKESHNIELLDFHEHYSGYRTFGWLWTDEEMTWYIDGEEVGTKIRGVDIPDAYWPNQDFCLILNNGLLAGVDGSTTSFPNSLEIDYIALYEASKEEPIDRHSSYEPESGLEIVLGRAGESCTNACSRIGGRCTVDSLSRGDAYTTRVEMTTTSEAVGAGCTGGVHREADWDVNPQISTQNYCFPTSGNARTNYNCDAVSTVQVNGQPAGQRVCSCGTSDFWAR